MDINSCRNGDILSNILYLFRIINYDFFKLTTFINQLGKISIYERNRQRYGYEQTAVEASESQRASQRGEALNLAGGKNTARLAQRERNRALLADLINISCMSSVLIPS